MCSSVLDQCIIFVASSILISAVDMYIESVAQVMGNFMHFYWMALFAICALGLWCHQDYGLSWDEPIVLMYGEQIMAYFSHGDPAFSTAFDRYHGSFPSLWMAGLDGFLSDLPSQERFFWIRRVNFLFFTLGGWVLAMLARKTWGNREGLLILFLWILSPRMFAESFYNTKDIPFVSLSLLCAWTGLRWIEKKTTSSMIIHAAAIALLTNTRILGVLVLVYSFLLGVRTKRDVVSFTLMSICSFGFLWIIWPILWVEGPLGIINAVSHMSHFPWQGTVLYQGVLMPAQEIPWHYIFVWMGMTIPILYLVLAAIGYQAFLRRKDASLIHIWMMMSTIVPIVLVLVLGSVMYDGWRHLYFTYPGILWFAVLGFRYLEERFQDWIRYVWMICTASVLWIGISMVELHPYEMVYFNMLAGDSQTLRSRFELDYWGLGFRSMLEYILRNDDREVVSVGVSNISGMYARAILSQEDQKRLRFVGKVEKADYFVTNFRWHPQEYPFPKVFSLMAGDVEIGAVYRISSEQVLPNKR